MKASFKLISALAICIAVFAACKPEPQPEPEPTIETGLEGQFMPAKKISSVDIYDLLENDSLDYYLTNAYEWHGDLLHSITQSIKGGVANVQTFQYDSLNRISAITDEYVDLTSVYNFIYEGKDLASVKKYDDGNLSIEYSFLKKDGKVAEIHQTIYGEITDESHATLEWDGDNVILSTVDDNGKTSTQSFTYDDKVSPLYGLYTTNMYYTLEETFSANNVLTNTLEAVSDAITIKTVTENEYEYDADGYPTKANNVVTVDAGFFNTVTKRVFVYNYLP